MRYVRAQMYLFFGKNLTECIFSVYLTKTSKFLIRRNMRKKRFVEAKIFVVSKIIFAEYKIKFSPDSVW